MRTASQACLVVPWVEGREGLGSLPPHFWNPQLQFPARRKGRPPGVVCSALRTLPPAPRPAGLQTGEHVAVVPTSGPTTAGAGPATVGAWLPLSSSQRVPSQCSLSSHWPFPRSCSAHVSLSPLSLGFFLPALQSESLVQDVSGPLLKRLSGLMNVLSLHEGQ